MRSSNHPPILRPKPGRVAPDEETVAGFRQGTTLDFRRVAVFSLLFLALQGLYGLAADTALERFVIERLTVRPAAMVIGLVDPAVGVSAEGATLRAPGGGVNILRGCEGADVFFIMMAAMLAAPLAWRWRLAGLCAAVVLMFAANQARVIGLFYAFRQDRAWFDALHGYVGPLLLVAFGAAFCVAWIRRFETATEVSMRGHA